MKRREEEEEGTLEGVVLGSPGGFWCLPLLAALGCVTGVSVWETRAVSTSAHPLSLAALGFTLQLWKS